MRRIDNGHAGPKRFLMLMNHPPLMHEKELPRNWVKDVAEGIMKEACDEVRSLSTGYTEEDDSIIMESGVTLDGTWQKRGFTSVMSWQYLLIRGKF